MSISFRDQVTDIEGPFPIGIPEYMFTPDLHFIDAAFHRIIYSVVVEMILISKG